MTSKWAHEIAVRFSINDTQATDYLYSVQRRCLPNAPRYPVIVDTIVRKGYTALPDPEQTAEEIKSKLASKPQIPNQQNKTHKLHKHRFRPSWREKQLLYEGIIIANAPGGSSGREPGVVSHTMFDEERVSPDKLGHCPHGIPDGELCGICNHGEFKKMTGID